MGYWDQLNTSKQNNKPQPYDNNFTGPVQPLKNGPPLPADTVNGPKLPASLAQKKEGDGFWAGLVKSPIKTLVVRPATRIAQAVSAPAALYSERSNTDTRERLITTQNQLAEAMRKQTDPTKKKKLAAAIADNQKTLDQFGGESEIVNKTLDKVFGPTEVNIPLAGSYNIPAQKSGVAGVKQIAGDALETAATLYGGEGFGSIGKEIVTNTVKKTLIQVAKPIIARGTATGTVGGFGFGLGQSLQEDMGLKDTIINTAVNTAVGAGSGALVSAGGFAVGQGINKAIQATTETKNALVEQLLRAGYSKERAMQLAEQGGYVGVGIGGYSADDLSKVAENSLLNNPENKLNKPNRLQGEGLSYQEATTGLANNGKYLKDRIVIGKNDAGTTILKDGTHLLEAYREKGLPIPADKVKLEDGVKLPDLRERGFISSVRQSPSTAPQIASEIRGNYTPLTNATTAKEAADLIRLNPDLALRVAKQTRPTAKSFAVAQELILKYQNEGNFEQAIDLAEVTAKKATQSGQAIQALSMYSRLSPEGVLRFAQRVVEKTNEETGGKLKLKEDVAKGIVDMSKRLQKLPEGRAKDIETAKLLQTISNIIPPSIGKKVSTIQTLAQLLNPKTIIRNIIGNTGFTVLENVSDVVGTPVDKALSVITGERTKTLPSVSTQMKSFNKGLREGVEDAWLGIDTSNNAGAKFDLPNTKVFKGKVLGNLEKLLSVFLRAPDRAAYEAAFQNSIKMQLKLNRLEAPTQEMIQQAHLDGLYRTFNDDSAASRAFQGIKDSLNKLSSPITGNDWGLGDLVLKYPKTPGNLLARGIDYSPAGFLQATIEMAKPLFGKTFNQRDFVNSVSRATVGTTGLVGVGALLHRIGILTGKANSDSDINAVQRATGIGQYKFNVSALKRFVLSGFDTKEAKIQPGDKLVSYDWFQPAAIGVAMGANIDESMGNKSSVSDKAKSLSGSLILALGEGVNTLGEQPLIQGITRPFKYAESIGDAALQTLKGVPASFIPTLLAQVRYIIDRNQRNLTDPSFVGETVNLAQNKIPGLSELLPQRYTATGEPMKYEQGPISTLINPSIITKYAVSPAQKLVLDIYNSSGEKQQAPRLVPKTETVNGEQIKLTGEQQSIMQRLMGEQVNSAFDRLANNQRFLKGSDEDKAKVMASIMTDIHTAVKFVVLGHRPNRISDRAKFYITQIRGDVDLPQNTGTTNTQQETPTKKKDYWSGL